MCTADITAMIQRQESKRKIYGFVFSAAAKSVKQKKMEKKKTKPFRVSSPESSALAQR